MIQVHIFHTGSVRVDVAVPYKEQNPFAPIGLFRGKDKKTELPVSCYLIEHPRGRVLIDSGWHSKYTAEPPRRFFGLLGKISTPVIQEGESIDCRLASMGLRPSDIDFLFFSHLDFDHTSGLKLLHGVRHVFAAEEENADADRYVFRYVKETWKGVDLRPFHYAETGIGPVGRSYDVFGDGSILLVNTPGHSHGHFSALVCGGEKYLVLAGDAVYTQKSIREKRLPGFTVDTGLAKRSLEWICKCVADKDCLLVAANHDPEVEPQTIEL